MIIRPTLSFLAPMVPISSLTCFVTSEFGSEGLGDHYSEDRGASGLADLTRPAPGKNTLTSRLHPHASHTPPSQTVAHESPSVPVGFHDDPFGLHLLGAGPAAQTAPATPSSLIAAADFDFGEVVVGGRYQQALYFYNLHPSAPAYVSVSMAANGPQDFLLLPPRNRDGQIRRPSREEQLPPAFVEENFYHLWWNPTQPGVLSIPLTITLAWQGENAPAQTRIITVKGTAYAAGQEKPSIIAARKAQENETARGRQEEDERKAALDRRVEHDNERDVAYPVGAVRALSAAYENAQAALTLLTEKQAIGARVAGEEAGRYRKKVQLQTRDEATALALYVLKAGNKALSSYAGKTLGAAMGGSGIAAALASTLISNIISNLGDAALKKAFGSESNNSSPDADNSDIYFFSSLEALLRDGEYARQTELQRTFARLETMTPTGRHEAVGFMEAIAHALKQTAERAMKEQADLARYAWMRELALRELGASQKTDVDGNLPADIENALWYAKEETAPGIDGVLDLTILTDRHHQSGLQIASAKMNGVIGEMASVLAEKPLAELRRLGVVMRVTLKDPTLADTLGYVVVDRERIVFLDKTGSPYDPADADPSGWMSFFSADDRGTPLAERQKQGAQELMALIGSQTLSKLGIRVTTDHDAKRR